MKPKKLWPSHCPVYCRLHWNLVRFLMICLRDQCSSQALAIIIISSQKYNYLSSPRAINFRVIDTETQRIFGLCLLAHRDDIQWHVLKRKAVLLLNEKSEKITAYFLVCLPIRIYIHPPYLPPRMSVDDNIVINFTKLQRGCQLAHNKICILMLYRTLIY